MSAQLKPVEPRRLYQQIADQIQRDGFDAGTRLPPERDLAQQLGVSRPSPREALIALDVEVPMIGELFDERHSPISAKLRSRDRNHRTWRLALEEHEAILHALESRDPLATQAAMRFHLEASEQRWVGG